MEFTAVASRTKKKRTALNSTITVETENTESTNTVELRNSKSTNTVELRDSIFYHICRI